MREDVERWWGSGRMVEIAAPGGEPVELFVRTVGQGPTVTLVHGYPSSSFDWANVSARLEGSCRVVALDLLGFGRSRKPWPHRYSIGEQTDLLLGVWDVLGVEATHVVAHDYGSSVGQELLSRHGGPELRSITFLNGGVYPHLHRPTDGQLLLRGPGGDELAKAIDVDLFGAALRPTFGSAAPATEEQLRDMWFTVSHDGGQCLASALLHYIDDRSVHEDRWVRSMERLAVPTSFVWGPEDPVSGSHMVEEIRRRMPQAKVHELPGVGHWPMLEDPEGVAEAVARTAGVGST